jgi:hypothetical protein
MAVLPTVLGQFDRWVLEGLPAANRDQYGAVASVDDRKKDRLP